MTAVHRYAFLYLQVLDSIGPIGTNFDSSLPLFIYLQVYNYVLESNNYKHLLRSNLIGIYCG